MKAFNAIIASLVLTTVNVAFADGGFIPAQPFAKVTIPDQRALIHYAEGVEMLVIDTSVSSADTNLAWIVPLPAEPEIGVSTRGLFSTLELIHSPRIFHDQAHGIIGLTLFLGILVLVIGAFVRGHSRRLEFGLLFLLLLVLLGLLLPASSTAGGGGTLTGSTIDILQRKTVGAFDTVTIKSSDGSQLLAWLNEHGFATPAAHLPVIKQYAKDGWVFVAARVNPALAGGTYRVEPVTFRFKTGRAVYPMKLTAVNNGTCRFELFVLGDQRAEINGWKVERCDHLLRDDFNRRRFPPTDGIALAQPELVRLAGASTIGTKLSATLSPSRMTTDAFVQWRSFEETYPLRFSRHGASSLAMCVAVCGIISLSSLSYLLGGFKWCGFLNQVRVQFAGVSIIAVAALGMLFLTPKVDVTSTRLPRRSVIANSRYLPLMAWGDWADQMKARHGAAFTNELRSIEIEDVRSQIKNLLADAKDREWQNPYTGELVSEEDSPGNYTLSQSGAVVEFKWFNGAGGVMASQLINVDGVREVKDGRNSFLDSGSPFR